MANRQYLRGERLTTPFFNSDTLAVAQSLLGKLLVHRVRPHVRLSGIIVEVEAYLHHADPASHSHRGRTPRNASMYAAAGTLYVYAIHAKYCANVVTETPGVGAAILIRALEPVEGIDTMMQQRATELVRSLTTGPAKLCQALALGKHDDGINLLTSKRVWLESSPAVVASKPWLIRESSRIGISQAKDLQYRFFIDGNVFVSGKASEHSMGKSWSFTGPDS